MARLVWRIAGSLLAVAMIASLGWNVVERLTSRPETRTHRMTADGIDTVEVDVDNGDIVVTGDPDASDVVVDAEMRTGLLPSVYRVERFGSTLRIIADCHSLSNSCLTKVDVAIPDGIDLELASDNGDVSGRHLVADRVEAASDNGSLRLVFDEPPTLVDAQSDNGDVGVMLPRSAADAEGVDFQRVATSDNGEVVTPIRTNPASSRSISASSDNGDVTVAYLP